MEEQVKKDKEYFRAKRKTAGFAVIHKSKGRPKFKMEELMEVLEAQQAEISNQLVPTFDELFFRM
jgi:hypothetical protein